MLLTLQLFSRHNKVHKTRLIKICFSLILNLVSISRHDKVHKTRLIKICFSPTLTLYQTISIGQTTHSTRTSLHQEFPTFYTTQES
jgi:hypothetical protein